MFFTLLACNKQKLEAEKVPEKGPGKIVQASWLIGTWSNAYNERRDYEAWEKYNDSTYLGRSYSIQNGDTVSSESIKLVEEGAALYYIPIVQGQNNNLSVSFKLITLESDKIIFENQSHDFPQRISYQLITQDSMIAEISGMLKGEHSARQFPMRRTE